MTNGPAPVSLKSIVSAPGCWRRRPRSGPGEASRARCRSVLVTESVLGLTEIVTVATFEVTPFWMSS